MLEISGAASAIAIAGHPSVMAKKNGAERRRFE